MFWWSHTMTDLNVSSASYLPYIPSCGLPSFCSGVNLIISSILRIVIAASVANLRHLTLDIAGSKTPHALLSLILPSNKSKPYLF